MKTKNNSRNECGSRTDETPKNINPQTGAWIAEHDVAIIAANRVQYANATLYTLEPVTIKKLDGYTFSDKENDDRRGSLRAALIVARYWGTTLKSALGMDKTVPESLENVLVAINRFDDENFYRNCFDLAEYYNQDCFFFKAKDGENPSDAVCVGTNLSPEFGYNVKISSGAFGPKAVNDYLRRISASSFGGSLPEINGNCLFFDGRNQDCGFDGADYARNHGVLGAMALNACGRNIWNDIEKHKYIYPDIQEFTTCEGLFRNILTFAVLPEQNPDTAATYTKGKKTRKPLFDYFNYYVSLPAEGRIGSYTGKLLIVINILFNDVKKAAEKCELPSFCFVNVKNGVIEYWATQKEDEPYNWFSNDYVKKNETTGFQFPNQLTAEYDVEGDSYKIALPTAALADISAKIQANVDKYFKGNSAIVDWCMNRWENDVYFRWDRLYKFD